MSTEEKKQYNPGGTCTWQVGSRVSPIFHLSCQAAPQHGDQHHGNNSARGHDTKESYTLNVPLQTEYKCAGNSDAVLSYIRIYIHTPRTSSCHIMSC